ncbi:MAG: hypothetical protein ACE5R6_06345 [Candidatus Heimdallarchaeota archaeon]
MTIEIELDESTKTKLETLASEAGGLSLKSAIELILRQFVENPGGRIYVGTWFRGNVGSAKGFRFVVQWPFKTGFERVKGDIATSWKK